MSRGGEKMMCREMEMTFWLERAKTELRELA